MSFLQGLLSPVLGEMDEHKRQALLAAAAGLLQGRGPQAYGQGLIGGLEAYNRSRASGDRRAEAEQLRKMRDMQMRGIEREQTNREGMQGAFRQAFGPNPNLVSGDDEGNPMPQAPGGGGMPEFLRNAGPYMDPMQAAQMMQPPKPKMAFAPNGQAVDMNALKPGQSFAKGPDLPAGMRMGQNGPEEIPGYVDMRRRIAAAGAPQVTTNVMPPREIFKDSMALKKDFDAQPEVKGFKEVQGAWDQISTALKSPSAANDLAAATKFMKLLDPGSVVRESELVMAMQASGALDRMSNYHNRLMKGEKLTPQQRQDFYSAGEALYKAAQGRFGETVNQYDGIAKQYGLDARFLPKKQEQAQKLQKNMTAIVKAKDAIKRGADPEAVKQRLREQGFDDSGL